MKDYTTSTPVFSKTIKVIETSDPGHADNVNVSTKQLLENSLSNRGLLNALMSFNYNEDTERIISMLPADYSDETLTIRDDMASVSGEKLILAVN